MPPRLILARSADDCIVLAGDALLRIRKGFAPAPLPWPHGVPTLLSAAPRLGLLPVHGEDGVPFPEVSSLAVLPELSPLLSPLGEAVFVLGKAFVAEEHPRDDAGRFVEARAGEAGHGPRHVREQHRDSLARLAGRATVALGKAALSSLRPGTFFKLCGMLSQSVWSTITSTLHDIAHPIQALKRVKKKAVERYQWLQKRYGKKGAVAIAGAYAGYYVAATMQPALMMYVPSPTAVLLGSAEAVRAGGAKAKQKLRDRKHSPEAPEGITAKDEDEIREMLGLPPDAPIEYDVDKREYRGGERVKSYSAAEGSELLSAALEFIADLAREAGEPVPQLDEGLLAQVILALLGGGRVRRQKGISPLFTKSWVEKKAGPHKFGSTQFNVTEAGYSSARGERTSIKITGSPDRHKSLEQWVRKGKWREEDHQRDDGGRFAGQGGGAAASLKLPKVGEKVRVDGATYHAEPLDGDDTFPPAIASFAVRDGYLFYQGRNGSEGVVTGSQEEAEQWMKDVYRRVEENPPSQQEYRPWKESDGGEKNLRRAEAMADRAADAFGVAKKKVEHSVAERPLIRGEHTAGKVALVNAHKSAEEDPASLHFKTPGVSHGEHTAAHEVMHQVFEDHQEASQQAMEELRGAGQGVSFYHTMAGHFEGLMELGAAYVHSPEALKDYSPKLFEIAQRWEGRCKGKSKSPSQWVAKGKRDAHGHLHGADGKFVSPGSTSEDAFTKLQQLRRSGAPLSDSARQRLKSDLAGLDEGALRDLCNRYNVRVPPKSSRTARAEALTAKIAADAAGSAKPGAVIASDVEVPAEPHPHEQGEREADRLPQTHEAISSVGRVPASEHDRITEDAARRVAGKYNLGSLVDLRRELSAAGLSRQEQDAALTRLRRSGSVSLASLEGRHGTTPEEREAALAEGDKLLGMIAMRVVGGKSLSPLFAKQWNSHEHPRDAQGRFTETGTRTTVVTPMGQRNGMVHEPNGKVGGTIGDLLPKETPTPAASRPASVSERVGRVNARFYADVLAGTADMHRQELEKAQEEGYARIRGAMQELESAKDEPARDKARDRVRAARADFVRGEQQALARTVHAALKEAAGLSPEQQARVEVVPNSGLEPLAVAAAEAAAEFFQGLLAKDTWGNTFRESVSPLRQSPAGEKMPHWLDTHGVFVGEEEGAQVVAHELGHALHHDPRVKALAREFLAHRCGDEPPTDISTINRRIRPGIKGRKDHFDRCFTENPWRAYYVGREYSSGQTEVLSMGLELLYTSPRHFAQTDPEWFAFTVGILTGEALRDMPAQAKKAWREQDHDRDAHGRFAEGGGSDMTGRQEMMGDEVGELLAAQYGNRKAGRSAADLKERWVNSERFVRMEIPLDAATPATEVVQGARTQSSGPIVVDLNKTGMGRHLGAFGAAADILILDGKHRHAHAREAGQKTIEALVGEKAIPLVEKLIAAQQKKNSEVAALAERFLDPENTSPGTQFIYLRHLLPDDKFQQLRDARKARLAGQPIPAAVLADYPDLAEKHGKKSISPLFTKDWHEQDHQRDEGGQFTSGGGGGTEKTDAPAPAPAPAPAAAPEAQGKLAKLKKAWGAVMGFLDRHTNVPVVKHVKQVLGAALGKVAALQKSLYGVMEKRYGSKAAKAVFLAAQATGSNPLIFPAWFTVLPGSTLLAQLPLMGVAEVALQVGRAARRIAGKKGVGEAGIPDAAVQKLAAEFLRELYQAFLDELEAHQDTLAEALAGLEDAGEGETTEQHKSLSPLFTKEWKEGEHHRDDHGRFSAGGGDAPAMADPRQEWKEKGVRSKAFLAWFGDWENAPASASKVVDPKTGEPQEQHPLDQSQVMQDGVPVMVYHGTPWQSFEEFKKSALAGGDRLLYGPGFYFTDSEKVAHDYRRQGSGLVSAPTAAQGEGHVFRVYLNIRNPLDLDKGVPLEVMPPDVQKHARDNVREAQVNGKKLSELSKEEWRGIKEVFDGILTSSGEATSSYRYHSLERFMADHADSQEFLGALSQSSDRRKMGPKARKVRDELEARGIKVETKQPTTLSYDAARQMMPAGRRTKEEFNKYLASKGYDGLTHTAQHYDDGVKDRVWVAFEPNQIKSADNEGTFDPGSPNINKGISPLFTKEWHEADHPRDDGGKFAARRERREAQREARRHAREARQAARRAAPATPAPTPAAPPEPRPLRGEEKWQGRLKRALLVTGRFLGEVLNTAVEALGKPLDILEEILP